MNCKVVCCLALLAIVASASPLPLNSISPLQPEALIDCSDLFLVQKLRESRIHFNCLPNSFVVAAQDDPSLNEIMSVNNKLNRLRGDALTRRGSEITLVLDAPIPDAEIDIAETDCVDPERCEVRVERIISQKCPENEVFVSEIGQCLAVALPVRQAPREDFFNPNSEILNDRACQDGFIFNLEKGTCLPDKKRFSVSGNFQEGGDSSESPFFSNGPSECDDGTIFNPEVGICLPVEPSQIFPKPQNTEPVAVDIEFPSPENCPSGTIFNPEVGICLFVQEKPEDDSSKEQPQAMALVSDKPSDSSSKPEKLNTWTETKKCEKGTVYVSEIDRCVPVETERPQGDSPAQSVTQVESVQKHRPFPLVLTPLTPDQIGKSKCPKGKVYVSEIDLCLDP